MIDSERIFVGTSRKPDDTLNQKEHLELEYANRHGLITGATGTGKTVTLQILSEGFSNAGVPVFCADIKGDVSGIAAMGEPKDFLLERARTIGLDPYEFQEFPVIFWDLFGEKGHPIRTTISEMGPLLLSRLMDCSDAQEGIINIAFRIADEEGLLLLDLEDLRSLLTHMSERARELSHRYGSVNRRSIGAIQRKLLVLEQQHAEHFFGEPALRIADIMRTTPDGRGAINILAADRLMMNPRLYATFLLWLLSELFEELPEVGDPDKPRLVFFFDEAHLLFDEAPKVLVERVEQVVRLIRSKGVGVYFVTQNPLDVPDTVLSQLGNRIQHALRAYTPREQRAVKTAADTFRPNPDFDSFKVITRLGVGEALVSTLEDKGVPGIVERTLIRPPSSRLGPLEDNERARIVKLSPVMGQYDEAVDRDSATEMLARRAQEEARAEEEARRREEEEERREDEDERRERSARSQWRLPDGEYGDDDDDDDDDRRRSGRRRTRRSRRSGRSRRRSSYKRQTVTEAAIKSLARSMSTQLGRALARGILGGIKRGF
ncbi:MULTISPECIES: helicase HerA-like domain-containing protein [unclassified Roseitalea]|uniref:helicase HerA-like domain-containing protein n=1 Tax=unclassified Roseitalea TaxID=2639107 RepID=UPI00273DF829|nr:MULTISPECIES: helicase HerA-like domain-containing protein [unclassified Roseitalea]